MAKKPLPAFMKKGGAAEEKAERKAGIKDTKAEEAKEVKNPKSKKGGPPIVFGKKAKK